eukprot:6161666-Prymnesium_polylepis.2
MRDTGRQHARLALQPAGQRASGRAPTADEWPRAGHARALGPRGARVPAGELTVPGPAATRTGPSVVMIAPSCC